ncbi:MAG: 50S ribosomal protein L13 [Parcubacteria group bacterium GW2011_GWD2_43_10]|uniref:Large ribosomal subunit protein uL13 n=5 Tax=Candidatus Vebleniibacteriota TaxID=1817921 RepID=A0A1G2Q6C4_9BACT|nr:MAG: 50S ribosomal protein L13 [Parcubacteria group bacterium GW2011_GWA2_42_80]KKS79304.1 MAG: 50S ribosomal protein L13 [Parcubacteria group bacterium GW2011_GWD1_42_9]KKS83853.1 MAG: 50S ribosomal protein L13 [Parcubacteria group bacterium GW2011_GWD2_43_10]KKS93004.1 MAG: 50S ribosomal protein L13 [Parcubacteria group bacterium GW2011_GWE2_43_12]KKT13309.1 MAG: 50S ribosomal protein L13 [Parcubacteria group bacterium GW2011_GWA1_43_27]KKT15315.1 MAG: 50S ribosomal protein L13 [Parcubact
MRQHNKSKATVITIDAAGRSLGRVASEAAIKLRGKHLASFAANKVPLLEVQVINIDKVRFTGSKLDTKKYYHFSGYPGGLRQTSLRQEFAKNPARLFRRIVKQMLPKNKLNSVLLNNLTISQSRTE